MKQIICAGVALLGIFCGTLSAVDSQLLNLAMPDARLLAGVNVTQAKSSPFGQYVLSQIAAGNAGLGQLATVTGFDPTQDVNELLLASSATPGAHTGLVTATGTFNAASIAAFAAAHGGITETYSGATILEDPKQTHGLVFFSGSLMAAGDLADLKAAIDRRANPPVLSSAQVTQAQQLSSTNDAWWVATVPPGLLSGVSPNPNSGIPAGLQNVLGNVQSVAGGVKFGAAVNVTALAQADSAQDATTLASALQFLISMGQLNGAKNPQLATALQSLTATAQGSMVTLALVLPEDQFQQLFQAKPNMLRPRRQNPK